MPLARLKCCVVMVVAVLLLSPALTFAQKDTGTVLGNVSDEHGTPLAGAKITLLAENTKQTKGGQYMDASTDGTGEFRIEGVKPGRYSIRFDSKGLISKTETINVKAGKKTNVNVHLKLPTEPKTDNNNDD